MECEAVEQGGGIEHRWGQVRRSSPLYCQTDCQGGNVRRGQEEEERDAEMNEKEEAEEEHEGDGDYETESSPARRGSRGRARAKGGSGDRRKSRLYLLLPLPYRCPPIPASTEADDVLGEEEDRDGETPTNGKERKRRWE